MHLDSGPGGAAADPGRKGVQVLNRRRLRWLAVLLVGGVAAVVTAPGPAVALMIAPALFAHLAIAFFRAWQITLGRLRRRHSLGAEVRALTDDELPPYTVLVPLLQEAAMVEPLTRHLGRLDYPADRLEILLLCEFDDPATANAVRAAGLDSRFQLVIVPDGTPRTKPRACNAGLAHARGELCVIYDAEDRPALDQLRRAAAAFAASPAEVMCLQARLDYHNHAHNWLTRCFTVEYGYWFDLLLPGLATSDLPIPLGGTSNHLRVAELRHLRGWDPCNVTEDAELGVRLYLTGARTHLLDSVTLEEACARPGAWIRQRSRWMKGYLQTWATHTSNPSFRHATWRTRQAVHALIGGTPLYHLLGPILSLVAIGLLFTTTGWTAPVMLGAILAGHLLTIYTGLLTVLHRRRRHLLGAAVTLPLYGLLASVATYRAVWHLFTRPYLWEKTPHGLSGANSDPVHTDTQPTSSRAAAS